MAVDCTERTGGTHKHLGSNRGSNDSKLRHNLFGLLYLSISVCVQTVRQLMEANIKNAQCRSELGLMQKVKLLVMFNTYFC